jgi:hypothetical protein
MRLLTMNKLYVFFDLEKAYDTTWKYGILRDLHDMGLRGICHYLSPTFSLNVSVRLD